MTEWVKKQDAIKEMRWLMIGRYQINDGWISIRIDNAFNRVPTIQLKTDKEMTNFERYKKNLKKEDFIKGMHLNCKGCPVQNCAFVGRTSQSITCEDVLKEWCDAERCESEAIEE